MKAEDTCDAASFMFEAPNQERIADFELKLMDIDAEQLGIPDTDYAAKCVDHAFLHLHWQPSVKMTQSSAYCHEPETGVAGQQLGGQVSNAAEWAPALGLCTAGRAASVLERHVRVMLLS